MPQSGFVLAIRIALLVTGAWLVVRLIRMGLRKAIWSLRNRLLVAYAFIALVPIILMGFVGELAFKALASQLTIYVTTRELDRRITHLHNATEAIARTEVEHRTATMRAFGRVLDSSLPGLGIVAREGARTVAWPATNSETGPPTGWAETSGIVYHNQRFYLWSHSLAPEGDVTALVPVDSAFLSAMSPGILARLREKADRQAALPLAADTEGRTPPLPAAVNRFDFMVAWLTDLPLAVWDEPAKAGRTVQLYAWTRSSVLLDRIFPELVSLGTAPSQGLALVVVAILFLVVECVALFIGISLTRTITGAVHDLYRGTQRVIEGDFSYRIPVARNDQLSELTTSFNVMTGNVERLLAVSREKERLQSEIEIAREVQNQLYPKSVPSTRTLRLTAVCQPARMVSGDYYDYVPIDEGRLALSVGDVAGKGISAALLMATVQSSVRAQLRGKLEAAAPSGRVRSGPVSTAQVVAELNQHLYAFTAAEKYATFWLGIYEDETGVLTYTNAGHLPPVIFRGGAWERLEVNGTVVGAFPFVKYEESRVVLQPGDLLVCYTDGITEPENEYGEMFGDDRLIHLVEKNCDRDEEKIASLVMDAVRQWTGSPELFDDMTLLLARRQ